MSTPNDRLFNDKDRLSIILEEYKICSSRADHLTTLIWSLATTLLSLSAGGLFLTGQLYFSILDRSVQPWINFRSLVAVCILSWIVALISSVTLVWWNKVANRWHNSIILWYHRMREIESELNMWCNRDIVLKNSGNEPRLPNEENSRYITLKKVVLKNTKPINELRKELTMAAITSWFFFSYI